MSGHEATLSDVLVTLRRSAGRLALVTLAAGVLALGGSFLVKPRYEARVSLMPPQQQQGISAAALASLGGLGALAGGVAGMKTPADQYVGLMQSVAVADRIIAAYELKNVYDEELQVDTRTKLAKRTRFNVGKRDGLIEIYVQDTDPKRAADIANRYVDELKALSSKLVVTEAQQRRSFFEEQLQKTRRDLTDAEQALGTSEFGAGALRAEPRAVVESYARIRNEVRAAEVRLRTMATTLSSTSPEVLQQQALLEALRAQLALVERSPKASGDGDYMERLREYKYREALFEVYARQFELARADEAREGAFIQVVDNAAPPERKVWPRRGIFTVFTMAAALVLGSIFVVWKARSAGPVQAA